MRALTLGYIAPISWHNKRMAGNGGDRHAPHDSYPRDKGCKLCKRCVDCDPELANSDKCRQNIEAKNAIGKVSK